MIMQRGKKKILTVVSERTVSSDVDVVLFAELVEILLREQWVCLNLISDLKTRLIKITATRMRE